MYQLEHAQGCALLEEAVTVCSVWWTTPTLGSYASLKQLSDSEVIILTLFQQLGGIESECSFLREAARFFSHLLPGAVGLCPSSFHRRVRKLRRHLEPLRREVLPGLIGGSET